MKPKTTNVIIHMLMGAIAVIIIMIVSVGWIIFNDWRTSKTFNQPPKQDISELLEKTKGDINIGNVELGKEVNYSASNELWEKIQQRRAKVKALEEEYFNDSTDEFMLVLGEVVNKSLEVNLSTKESFDELYNKYILIFISRYDKTLDEGYSNNEYIQTIQELITNEYVGDCEDYALALFIIATKKNMTSRIVVSDNHAWLQIYKNNRWIEYDSTSNKICANCISNQYKQIAYYSR